MLASILRGLGVDVAPFGLQLGSNLAPKSAQEPPKAAQQPPKSRTRCLGAAQDEPRGRPGAPRSATDSTPYPGLEKNSQLHPALLPNFLPCHKAANFKNERRRYSPQGGLQSAAQRGRRAERFDPGLLVLPSPISLDQVPDSKVLGA